MIEIAAQSAILVDAVTGEVYLQKEADARRQVASTQKLLTALVISQAPDLAANVTVLAQDEACLPFRVNLTSTGSNCSREQLLHCMLVASANDAANALARDNAGDHAAFAKKMNLAAEQLQMTNSYFSNPSGLPDDRQFSTAKDLARLAAAVEQSALLKRIVGTQTYSLRLGSHGHVQLSNTNKLLGQFPLCDGMKTGFTKAAGYCLIATAGLGRRRRILVLLGSAPDRLWSESRSLLEWSLLV